MVNEKEAWKQKLCGAFFDPGDQGSSLVHSGCSAIPQCLSIFSSQNLFDIHLINDEKSIQKSHFFFQSKPPLDSVMKCKHEWSGWHANKRSFFLFNQWRYKSFEKSYKLRKYNWQHLQWNLQEKPQFSSWPSGSCLESESDDKLCLCKSSVFLVKSCPGNIGCEAEMLESPKKNLISAIGWWQLT